VNGKKEDLEIQKLQLEIQNLKHEKKSKIMGYVIQPFVWLIFIAAAVYMGNNYWAASKEKDRLSNDLQVLREDSTDTRETLDKQKDSVLTLKQHPLL